MTYNPESPPSSSTTDAAKQAAGQAREAAGSVASTAKHEAGGVAHDATERGKRLAGQAGHEAKDVGREARRQTADLYRQSRSELTDQARSQQQRVAGGLRSLSGELGTMAGASEERGLASGLADQAAERTEALAQWLEDHEPGDLLEEVKEFARRRPGAFLAGAAVAGLLVGRLTRGMRDDRAEDTGTAGARPVTGAAPVGALPTEGTYAGAPAVPPSAAVPAGAGAAPAGTGAVPAGTGAVPDPAAPLYGSGPAGGTTRGTTGGTGTTGAGAPPSYPPASPPPAPASGSAGSGPGDDLGGPARNPAFPPVNEPGEQR